MRNNRCIFPIDSTFRSQDKTPTSRALSFPAQSWSQIVLLKGKGSSFQCFLKGNTRPEWKFNQLKTHLTSKISSTLSLISNCFNSRHFIYLVIVECWIVLSYFFVFTLVMVDRWSDNQNMRTHSLICIISRTISLFHINEDCVFVSLSLACLWHCRLELSKHPTDFLIATCVDYLTRFLNKETQCLDWRRSLDTKP